MDRVAALEREMGLLTKETAKELSKIKSSDQGSSRPLYGWDAAKAHANAQAKLQASDAAWGPSNSNQLKNNSQLVRLIKGTKNTSPLILLLCVLLPSFIKLYARSFFFTPKHVAHCENVFDPSSRAQAELESKMDLLARLALNGGGSNGGGGGGDGLKHSSVGGASSKALRNAQAEVKNRIERK